MKRIAIAICAVALLSSCNNDSKDTAAKPTDTTHTDAKADEWIPVDSATVMRTMMEAATPGKEHAMLAKSNGTWKAETTMWMEPGGPAMTSTGVATNKMIMGGRYQQMSFKGDMMGQPFEGVSTTGYDNSRKVWTTNWIDNMGTGIMNMDGTWDDATKTLTYKGKVFCAGNGKMTDMRQVIKVIDDNTEVMEMYGPDMKTGKEFKGMEIKLTRQ